MDRHYSEQAHVTESTLDYLHQTRPDWLKKKRVLISAGTNLLDAYKKGAAGILESFLKQLSVFKNDHPELQNRIPSD